MAQNYPNLKTEEKQTKQKNKQTKTTKLPKFDKMRKSAHSRSSTNAKKYADRSTLSHIIKLLKAADRKY